MDLAKRRGDYRALGGQRCLSFSLETEPRSPVRSYRDRHGNDVRNFDCLQPHRGLVVKATSEVLTTDVFGDPEASLSPLDAFDYLAPTHYAPLDDSVRAMQRRC